VDEDVDAVGEALGDPLRRLRRGDVELDRVAVDLGGDGAELLARLRDVEADDARPVAGQGPGDRGADPSRGAGDERRPAGERAPPVEVGEGRDPLPDLDHLP
jgi:hypothetical protein